MGGKFRRRHGFSNRHIHEQGDSYLQRAHQAVESPQVHKRRKTHTISDPATNELVIVDATARKLVKLINVGKGPGGILVAPPGDRAYVALAGDNGVAVIDLRKLEVIERIPTGQGPDGLAWAERH